MWQRQHHDSPCVCVQHTCLFCKSVRFSSAWIPIVTILICTGLTMAASISYTNKQTDQYNLSTKIPTWPDISNYNVKYLTKNKNTALLHKAFYYNFIVLFFLQGDRNWPKPSFWYEWKQTNTRGDLFIYLEVRINPSFLRCVQWS